MATLEKTQKSSESFADLFEESMVLKEMRQGEIITAEVKTEKKSVGKLAQSVRMVANTVPSMTVLRIKANVVLK